jgi:subtilisin family serine protease
MTANRTGIYKGIVRSALALLALSVPLYSAQKLTKPAGHTKVVKSLRATIGNRSALSKGQSRRTDIRFDGSNRIQVYLHVNKVGPNELALLGAEGVKVDIAEPGLKIVQAWLPVERLDVVAALDFITAIRPPEYRVTFTGSVTTEGDDILRADQVRNSFGVDGTGIRVGVISDGIDSRAEAQASGDLPATIVIHPVLPGEGDEGTAMLEIIHDLAPGAQLAFSGPQTSVEMVSAINYLANNAFGGQGCDIIVDDLGFLSEPAFEDGKIANAVKSVVEKGIVYLTAAGNQAREHYEGNYLETTFQFKSENLSVHDFGKAAGGATDETMLVQVDGNSELTVILQWNDPNPGSRNDYDLLLIDQNLTDILAISEENQSAAYPWPLEMATFENNSSSPINVQVVIRNNNAPAKLLEMHFSNGTGSFSVEEYNVAAGSVVPGQQSSSYAITIGAIFVLDNKQDDIQDFSSLGPARIFFPSTQDRVKPDVAAVDGGLITGAGGFGSDWLGNTRFFGTSAAAPHAAAVVALMLQASPSLTPAQVKTALTNSAIDLGVAGTDNTFGFGRIDALAAVNRAITAVQNRDTINPDGYSLGANFPNPFNPRTRISYHLSTLHVGSVVLEVYNHMGRKVKTLVDATQEPGEYFVEWDGRDDAGTKVTSGLYVYRIVAQGFSESKKMVLMK